MHTTQTGTAHEQMAAAGSVAGAVVIVLCGLLITGAPVWTVPLGIRVRRREPAPPERAEQPTLPESGPVREERQMREPSEVPRATGKRDRPTPHELGNAPSRPREDQTRPDWNPGSSGSFGSGGSDTT
ncbi:DUF6479 family protein [Streptomyces sp. NBS 14/10]|uniref:DUF6479 family protein n=1 Tax=Streptomyces sp. NBS 14/10 TaxID=1945643 RepID=UPI00211B69A5|nr:DUF6479 family protein [Streptomyces sp. NBS 14/10]KAK1185702.1 DUF6479 family protein [Streptomyces sp. NBS 14/10]